MERKAIVTLVVGKAYLERWEKLCRPNWQRYADRHGYDLIVIDAPLDTSVQAQNRSPAWQKCLILSQDFSKSYERLVWIDSDILINAAAAPCITEHVPLEKVGAVDAYSAPSPELYRLILDRQYAYFRSMGGNPIENYTPQEFYRRYGLPEQFDRVAQTGVLVLSPHYHRQILEKTYYEYEDKGDGAWNYEMRPLSWELMRSDCMHWLDYRFNLIWPDYLCLHYPFLFGRRYSRYVQKAQKLLSTLKVEVQLDRLRYLCANTAFANSFFLHFSGTGDDMFLVDAENPSWRTPLKAG